DRGYIRIAVANEIPYGFVDPNGDAKGAGPEVATAVVKALGIAPENIQWVVTNFSSLIPGLQADRFDMTAAEMAIRPERCDKVIYSEPDTSYGEGLLVLKGDPKGVHTYADFTKPGMKVAVMAGADQLGMMQKLGVPEANIVTINANPMPSRRLPTVVPTPTRRPASLPGRWPRRATKSHWPRTSPIR